MEESLTNLRKKIDALDTQLVDMINQRATIAQKVGTAKKDAPVYRPQREKEVLDNIARANKGPLSEEAVRAIYTEVIAACRNLQHPLRVAHLGPEGTYSEEAALKLGGTTSEYIPCATIDEAIRAVEHGESDLAIVPAENSTEGTIHRTLDLLLTSPAHITGEIMLPVRHQLLTQARSLKDIQRVVAHPQALAQCRQWLAAHIPHAKLLTSSSNAEAAKQASKDASIAAIASLRASEIYTVPILATNIADASTNTTRFLVLGSQVVTPSGNDKTSLVCSLPNKAGSLHKFLGIFAERSINITKLESRPSDSGLWDYVFYIDVDGHQTDPSIAAAVTEAGSQATMMKVLGSYPKATI